MRPRVTQALRRLDHLTFRGNLRDTRYGWLRLTPAYSIHLVSELLEQHWRSGTAVLDPFCGTGTTALACAERGIECDTTDINPFLLWLAAVKSERHSSSALEVFRTSARAVGDALIRTDGGSPWLPPLHQIEKWWAPATLGALGRAMGAIRELVDVSDGVIDLLRIAFCRTLIAHANVSFGHQSMSFQKKRGSAALALALDASDEQAVLATWGQSVTAIGEAAQTPILQTPRAIFCDARDLRRALPLERYGCVITSPPYPNRMSYIRELRPYMYWLGYLADGRQAGELDWQAIGGTWGSATSNVAKWTPAQPVEVQYPEFRRIVEQIGNESRVLGRYVDKYFYDMVLHCRSLLAVVAPGGTVHYIVGNSKFYDVMLPVEQIFAAIFEQVGFVDVELATIRKRTSKKELFEFVVSARRPLVRG
jgi:hypothetical protein